MPPATGRHALTSLVPVVAPPRESAPSDPQRRRTDADNPWRPDPDNLSPEASLKRDNVASARIDALEAEGIATRGAVDALTVEVRGVSTRLDGLATRWDGASRTMARVGWPVLIALCIMAACGLAGIVWGLATRVRLDPPSLPTTGAPR